MPSTGNRSLTLAAARLALPLALVATLALGLPLSARGQGSVGGALSLEEILRRHAEAKGGLDAWSQVHSLELTGTYTAFSREAPFRLRLERPNRYRFDYSMLDAQVSEVYDGTVGWTINPLGGFDWPVRMSAPEVTAVLGEVEIGGPLLEAEKKGHAVELVGRADFEGTDAYELHLTRKDGAEETWFLDADSFLEVGRIYPVTDFGRPFEQRAFYGEHQEVAGVQIPHYFESDFFIRFRVLAVEEVKVNPDLEEGIFTLPLPPGMAALSPMAGEWEVKVETRPVPQAPWSEATVPSVITSLAGGALLEERLSMTLSGKPAEVVRQLSFDRFAETYRLAVFEDLTGVLRVLEGKLEEGRLTASNLETGTTRTVGGQTLHDRIQLHEIAPEGFQEEWEISTDGGETWFTQTRLTYRRAPREPAEEEASSP